MQTNLTIQTIVKNEPFIYYAIKSVYDYCDKILLYDTGSNDEHTKEDIYQLLDEDHRRKIVYKEIPIKDGEELWSLDTVQDVIEERRGFPTKGQVRQRQIDDTETEYFMLVDGDEIHYKSTMEYVTKSLIPNFPKDKLCVGFPLTWFWDMDHTFTSHTFPVNGRLMPTDKVVMNDDSPNEKHLIKATGEHFTYEHPQYLTLDNVKPYAHFESMLKPWRRKHLVPMDNVKPFSQPYPEVIYENSLYVARYMDEQKS